MSMREDRLIEDERVRANIENTKHNQRRNETTNRDQNFFQFAKHGRHIERFISMCC
jgi:hypothetical protein